MNVTTLVVLSVQFRGIKYIYILPNHPTSLSRILSSFQIDTSMPIPLPPVLVTTACLKYIYILPNHKLFSFQDAFVL